MSSATNEDTAARWLVKRESGSWTDEDECGFNEWIAASTANRIAYLRLQTTWSNAAKLKALNPGLAMSGVPTRGAWSFQVTEDPPATDAREHVAATSSLPSSLAFRNRARWVGALAATLVICAIGLYALSTGLFAGRRYATPVGGRDTVALHDGSHVTLNTDSKIRVEFGPGERRVALNQGEVFFEVAKDAARPFVVEAGGSRVTAVGTQFSIRRQSAEIQVVVTEGTVRIESGSLPASTKPEGGSPQVLVTAGNVAQTANGRTMVRAQAQGEAERLLSWRGGYVSFENATLTEAVAEFNRYNARQIVIRDPSIANIRLSGNFRTNNVEGFLSLLHDGFDVSVDQSAAAVTLQAR